MMGFYSSDVFLKEQRCIAILLDYGSAGVVRLTSVPARGCGQHISCSSRHKKSASEATRH
jgi:hypothetical protein